ncbi:uncharacterized protein LOC117299207 [Asterias rubens]|uniref:uncharacterized protein LOC117299207 n=1 Tax=Asterias rubens TaxID=7604 RepID=UPI0014552A56|nr:uncharacterized protein LOC117299207 [Asterias rubens]
MPCDAGLGTRKFFEQINEPPQKLMLIGPACSTSAQAVAQTSFYWNLITMSYSAGSSALSNRVEYPYFYRTYMPDAMLNRARIRIIKDFGWKRVATIHENKDLFSLAIDDMINLLNEENITVISSESFDEDPTNQIANLKKLDARVILVNTYESKARRIMCEAWRQNIVGPGYVWFLLGWWTNRWWTIDDQFLTKCTIEEVKQAVETSLYIGTECALFGEENVQTVSGITPNDFDDELRRRLSEPGNENYTYNGIASFGYDAAWAMALALNKTAQILKTKRFKDGTFRRLEEFTYDDIEMSKVFFDAIDETNFYGTSGPVSFSGADRIAVTQIEQLRVGCWPNWLLHNDSCYLFVDLPATGQKASTHCSENDESQLAVVDSQSHLDFLVDTFGGLGSNKCSDIMEPSTQDTSDSTSCSVFELTDEGWVVNAGNCNDSLPFICQDKAEYLEVSVGRYDIGSTELKMDFELLWPGGVVPPDQTPNGQHRVNVYVGIDLVTFICFSSLAGVGILLSLAFLAFNVWHRKLRIVRMSSPNLNNIILIGTSLIYVSVIFYGIDGNIVKAELLLPFCHVRVWLLSVGFVLAFGAMFSKTWRVHKVVAFKTPKRKVVQDRQLMAMVAVLLLIDCAILLPWQLISPWREDEYFFTSEINPTNRSQTLAPYVKFCTGDYYIYWTVALTSYKGLLLLFGAFLAWETRQVTIPALNDSKLIGMSVYNVVILCIVGLAINLVLGQDTQTLFIFNSSISMFCTTLTILIVFLPKVISVLKNSKQDLMSQETRKVTTSHTSTDSNMVQENLRMKHKVKLLERQLKELRDGVDNDRGRRDPSASSEPPDKMKICSYNCGMWCCGLMCGCSPRENKNQDEDKERYVHTNEVDLTLEMTTSS